MILNKSLKIFPHVRTGREKSQIQEKLVRLNISFSVSEPKQSALPGHTPVLTLSNSLKPGNDIWDVLQLAGKPTGRCIIDVKLTAAACNLCWRPHWLLVGMGILLCTRVHTTNLHACLWNMILRVQGFSGHPSKRPTFFNMGFNLSKEMVRNNNLCWLSMLGQPQRLILTRKITPWANNRELNLKHNWAFERR